MIEIMVSLILLSLGLVGSTQLITSAIREQSALKYKITASQVANALMERMRSNRLALDAGWYVDINNATGAVLTPRTYSLAATLVKGAGIPTTLCNPACISAEQAARLDIYNARIALKTLLRSGAALSLRTVTSPDGAIVPGARLIIVAWAEPILNTVTTASSTTPSPLTLPDGSDGCPSGFNDNTSTDINVKCLQFRFQP